MATVAVTPLDIVSVGTTTAYTGSLSTSNTYTASNDGRTFLHFKKTGAGVCTVTVTPTASYKGNTLGATTVSVPATTGDVMVGPFSPDVFNDANGNMAFTLSEVTGLSVGVFHLPAAK